MSTIQPVQSRFADDSMAGLQRCQTFIAHWLLVVTSWSARIRPPFPGGPPSFLPIQQDLLLMIYESCGETTSFVQQIAAYQFRIGTLPEHNNQSGIAIVTQGAWARLQAIGFACGVIRVLEVADSCFSFGPHFSGGDNAAARESYFGSLDQSAHATAFWAAIQALAAVLDPKLRAEETNGHGPTAVDRRDIDYFHEKILPTARVALQTAWDGCLKTLKSAARQISQGEQASAVPASLQAEAEMFFGYGDQALKTAEGLFATIPGFAVSLRRIGENGLAELLEAIAVS
jgi:hypothetical protein